MPRANEIRMRYADSGECLRTAGGRGPGVISANKPESFSSKLLSHRKTFSTSAPAADKTNHGFSSTPDKDNLFLPNSLEEKRSC